MSGALVLSCEHGGNRLPRRQRALFAGAARVLDSHRGWDPGALVLARRLARAFRAPLVEHTTSRLVVDPNRSATNPRVFSKWTRCLSRAERDDLLARYWSPHRDAVVAAIEHLRPGPVHHVSVHSFTPRFRGAVRRVDVGLLYDPARRRECVFADAWLRALHQLRPELVLRRNHPYRGTSDGVTTALRRRFPAREYLGLELEVSQRHARGHAGRWLRLQDDLARSLAAALGRADSRDG